MPAFKRLDHLICAVPDIETAFRLFTEELQFPIAWPISRFWPSGRTSGVALGGLNLELLQPDENPPLRPTIDTLVFEPTSIEAVHRELDRVGVPYTDFRKKEPDPRLLAMRGFQGADLESEQLICDNVYPDFERLPIRYFVCDYGPFLKRRLSPENPELRSPYGAVQSITVGLPDPRRLEEILQLGYSGLVDIDVVEHPTAEVVEIRLSGGQLAIPGIEAGFRFTYAE